jgi:hypothetical protein
VPLKKGKNSTLEIQSIERVDRKGEKVEYD